MNRRNFIQNSVLTSAGLLIGAKSLLAKKLSIRNIKVLCVFNNTRVSDNLTNEFGLSFWIEDEKSALLFDTGKDGTILWDNLVKSKVNIKKLTQVFISHRHQDHRKGLDIILEKTKNEAEVYVPNDNMEFFKSKYPQANLKGVKKPEKIKHNYWSTGQIKGPYADGYIYEHSLVIIKNDLLYLFTGCSHPVITNIVKKTKDLFLQYPVELVAGGFHLYKKELDEVKIVSKALKDLKVNKIAPSHCTGEEAINLFKDEWGSRFVDSNLGDQILI